MDEFTLIRQCFASASNDSSVALGIGDDCALLTVPNGQQLAISMDTLVEGTHFLPNTAPEHIASRALATAISDLAAIGAKPLWFTLGLTLPAVDDDWITAFSESLFNHAKLWGCSLVGGDTTRGPLSITVQVHGAVEPNKALKRSGANAGDVIYVTGHLGDGAAALALLQHKLTLRKPAQDYLKARFYRPTPQLEAGQLLAGIASSAIDISDGLYADLGHICHASGVGARVDVNRLPLSEYWRDSVSRDQALAWAISGGDDYQLCFTVPKTHIATIEQWQREGKLQATAIGKMTENTDILMVNKGKAMDFDFTGYQHFE